MSVDALYFPADRALVAMGNTSRRWESHYDSKKVYAPDDEDPVRSQGAGRGRLRQLSLATIAQGRIAFSLIDCGVEVREAYRVGAQFVYLGEIRGPFGRDTSAPLDPVLDRMAGRLFAKGDTYLIYSVGALEPYESRISIISDSDPAFGAKSGRTTLGAVLHTVDGDGSAPRIVLNLSQLCAQIAATLSLDFTAAFVTEIA
ncbi:MAG: hypothetical protein KDK01_11390 [Rhodobacteraceae bacterium]|nr:hypothetical protein [Paracoccaceae bacterium]